MNVSEIMKKDALHTMIYSSAYESGEARIKQMENCKLLVWKSTNKDNLVVLIR